MNIRLIQLGLAVGVAFACSSTAQAAPTKAQQTIFAAPSGAVDALVKATAEGRTGDIVGILGPQGKRLVYSGDPVADRTGREQFVAAYDQGHRIQEEPDDTAWLYIGKTEWPFPIPLIKQGEGWRFNTAEGVQEILYRRIGRDELNAIEVAKAYVDAQIDFATTSQGEARAPTYADKFISSPGKHDGLYWPAPEGAEASPMGPLMALARAEGYQPKHKRAKALGGSAPYHGYYYRILTAQGPAAPGGAYDYKVDGHLMGGFGLIAFPAKYGESGVMSFIVNHTGVVFEKNLGPDSARIAGGMTSFDPDSSWTKLP